MAQGLGFADSLTKHLALMTLENTPEFKLNWQGYLNMLMSNTTRKVVRLNDPQNEGHRRQVLIKAQQRFDITQTDTAEACDQVLVPAYFERTVALSSYRQISLYIDNETIAQYPTDASQSISVGKAPIPIMNEFVLGIKRSTDALVSAINQDLLTIQAAQIGVNVRSGNNAAQGINLRLDTTNNPLNQGMTQILADYAQNQSHGKPKMVGSGLPYNYFLQQKAKSPDQSGVSTPVLAGDFDFFYDPFATTALGANQAIVFEPNAVNMVEYMRFKGFKNGDMQTSFFFTIMLPIQLSDRVANVEFDCQLRFLDCPQTLTNSYYGTDVTVDRGWQLIISKTYGLFTIDQAYRGTDLLSGNRGTYRYAFTNA